MFKKMFYLVAILIFSAVSFSVYLHEEDIDDLAFIIAIGIDESEDDNLKMTFQISIPSDNSSSNKKDSSNSKESSSDTLIKNVECKSINSGLNQVNNLINKRVDLSHCMFVIFSESIAEKGISEHINTLENNLELRSHCNIIVSSCEAKDFIESVNPVLETSTAQLYEILKTATKYTGSTSDSTLNTVYTSIEDTFGEASAILGNLISSQDESDNTKSNSDSKNEIELAGIAVFKGDKFVGELSIDETICYLITTNRLKQCVISIPSPFYDDKNIDVHLSQFYNTKNSVEINDSIPKINSVIYLESTIMSSSTDFDSQSSEDVIKLQNSISKYIQNQMIEYFNKISKEYKSDISQFGKYAVYLFPTESDWKNYNWLDKFNQAEFNVTVNVNINTSYFVS